MLLYSSKLMLFILLEWIFIEFQQERFFETLVGNSYDVWIRNQTDYAGFIVTDSRY